MEITQHKVVNKGALAATFSVKFKTAYGNLVARKMAHFKKDSQEWITWASEQYEKDGQKKYFQFCIFEEMSDSEIFQQDCLNALREYTEENQGGSTNNTYPSREKEKAPPVAAAPPKPEMQEALPF